MCLNLGTFTGKSPFIYDTTLSIMITSRSFRVPSSRLIEGYLSRAFGGNYFGFPVRIVAGSLVLLFQRTPMLRGNLLRGRIYQTEHGTPPSAPGGRPAAYHP